MPATISITVPPKTTTCFVVATEREPGDARLAMLRRLAEPFAAAATERLSTSRLAVTSYRAADSPWDLTGVAAADDHESETRARKAVHHIGVTSLLQVAGQPFGTQLARAAARALADVVAGVIVDLNTGQIVPQDTPENPRFALADDWLGVSLPPEDEHCSDGDDSIDGCSCVELTTRGLRRFGLPELQIAGVACPHDLAALNVLRATAQRLMPVGRLSGPQALPSYLPLVSDDLAGFWGIAESLWADGPLPVQLTSLGPRLIGVGPPPEFQGTLNEWLWDELPPVMHELLGCTAEPLPS
ncbi:hypothetical protein [Actinomadura rudentiformis]|uniref:Uncharacterized protein n=1 Tax=Actinomadura rudentiformis TaxID=359158 RepID=A0A6H9YY64_9ACTN|nr:hypothetical protein [Actinomadura rudentiformis]KAB2346821.1 hypothetical protein F8566_21590 [Actinomadura rudentiformis]